MNEAPTGDIIDILTVTDSPIISFTASLVMFELHANTTSIENLFSAKKICPSIANFFIFHLLDSENYKCVIYRLFSNSQTWALGIFPHFLTLNRLNK